MTTEFNGNINFGKIPASNAAKSVDKNQVQAEHTAEVNNLDSVPVGQSSVAGKSQIKADNVANDLLTFCANPKLISVADNFFDKAYASLIATNDPNAYEKACLMTSEFVKECAK